MDTQDWRPDSGDTVKSALWIAIVVEYSIAVALTIFFTVARLVARLVVTELHVEDYLSVAALIIFLGHATTLLVQGTYGFGSHIWNVNVESLEPIMKMIWATEILYCIETWIAKAALLFQMQRIFAPKNRGAIFIACQCLIWINLAFYLSSLVAVCVECIPTAKVWDILVQGHCISDGALLIATGVMNIISDICILILPLWAIWHLHLPLKLKFGVSLMFAVGLLAVACSICRFAYTFPAFRSRDHTYFFAALSMWSIAEVASIIICTCFPLMPRFFHIITGQKHLITSANGSKFSTLASRQRSNTSAASARTAHRNVHRSTYRCRDCINGLPCLNHDRTISVNGSGTTFGNDNSIDKETTDDTMATNATTETSASVGPALENQNPLASNNVITVQREFRVQRNVRPERLDDSDTAGRWSGQSNIFSSFTTTTE